MRHRDVALALQLLIACPLAVCSTWMTAALNAQADDASVTLAAFCCLTTCAAATAPLVLRRLALVSLKSRARQHWFWIVLLTVLTLMSVLDPLASVGMILKRQNFFIGLLAVLAVAHGCAAWAVNYMSSATEVIATDVLQLLRWLKQQPAPELRGLHFDGEWLIGTQLVLADRLRVSTATLNRQIKILRSRRLIEAETNGGITMIRLAGPS